MVDSKRRMHADVGNLIESLELNEFDYISFKGNEDKIKSAIRWPIYKEIIVQISEKNTTKDNFRLQRLSTVKS